MIDWLTFTVTVAPHNPFAGGVVQKISPDGEIEWTSTNRMEIAGSHESSIYVRSLDSTTIQISGNPCKYFQGHNLWGSDDIKSLAAELTQDVADKLKYQVFCIEPLTRVDVTQMIDLGTEENVHAVLRSLGQAATMRNRGKGTLDREGTIYWGKHSRRWALKVYAKRDEVVSTKTQTPLETVAEIARGKLRIELVLRGMELKNLGLRTLGEWSTMAPMQTLKEFLSRLELPDQNVRLEVSQIPAHLRAPFVLWAQGDDIRTMYSRATAYRHRKQLLEQFGIDLFVPPAEPIQKFQDKEVVGFQGIPDIRTLPFWSPSPEELAQLTTYIPTATLPDPFRSLN